VAEQNAAEPAPPGRYERAIAEGLDAVFESEQTEELELDLDSAKLIIFSDHHKGARDGADDFWRCERTYAAALGYYLEAGHRLYVLGDVEELWENSPDHVLASYPAILELEGEFHRQGRYERFFGNHDDLWRHEDAVNRRLGRFFPGLGVRQALKLRVGRRGEDLGLVFLVHGHQGTLDSARFAWLSRLVVRFLWRPLQRHLRIASTTPAADYELRARHDHAMFIWARRHPDNPVLIAGHTHRPVFGNSKPPPVVKRSIDTVASNLEGQKDGDEERARLRAELEFGKAARRRPDPPPHPIEPPCYFNTGCCSFGDGDVTGLEIDAGQIRLVRWPNDAGEPLPKVLASADLAEVLEAVAR
jgi:UDP-2,3-diacylglucosamine pyrophosphatase LpxH